MVAVSLARTGVGGAIALAECDRAAARRRAEHGAIGSGGAAGLPGGSSGVSLASTSMLLALRISERGMRWLWLWAWSRERFGGDDAENFLVLGGASGCSVVGLFIDSGCECALGQDRAGRWQGPSLWPRTERPYTLLPTRSGHRLRVQRPASACGSGASNERGLPIPADSPALRTACPLERGIDHTNRCRQSPLHRPHEVAFRAAWLSARELAVHRTLASSTAIAWIDEQKAASTANS
jgi:hypothetical protein